MITEVGMSINPNQITLFASNCSKQLWEQIMFWIPRSHLLRFSITDKYDITKRPLFLLAFTLIGQICYHHFSWPTGAPIGGVGHSDVLQAAFRPPWVALDHAPTWPIWSSRHSAPDFTGYKWNQKTTNIRIILYRKSHDIFLIEIITVPSSQLWWKIRKFKGWGWRGSWILDTGCEMGQRWVIISVTEINLDCLYKNNIKTIYNHKRTLSLGGAVSGSDRGTAVSATGGASAGRSSFLEASTSLASTSLMKMPGIHWWISGCFWCYFKVTKSQVTWKKKNMLDILYIVWKTFWTLATHVALLCAESAISITYLHILVLYSTRPTFWTSYQ